MMLGDGDGGIDDVAADGASLTAEQRLVLQAVYDHFQKHASWPTFITIDRPLRRTHGFDTAAIFLSLPDSLVVEPRPGGLRPIANDELRLRLPGIQACAGGDVDTERFVRLLRRLAQEEVEFEPEAGDPPEMLQVTAGEVAEHLGLDQADHIGLGRLFAMLQLDNWGLAGSGSDDDDWYVWRPTGFVDTYIMPLTPFSCQFRVHTRMASDTPVPSESSDDCSTLL